ncbi:hypothetical protein HETIRDRAFT_438707, partial [Heterobasidion irregulare TC 32-1]
LVPASPPARAAPPHPSRLPILRSHLPIRDRKFDGPVRKRPATTRPASLGDRHHQEGPSRRDALRITATDPSISIPAPPLCLSTPLHYRTLVDAGTAHLALINGPSRVRRRARTRRDPRHATPCDDVT